jgi:acyl-coenzyme A synthetase/AMP-(fatty) acid ligase
MHVAPLIAHGAPDAVVAFRSGESIRVAQFIADVAQLAAELPTTGHVLNACQDRYSFAVGFAACVSSNRVSLLPSTHTPEAIRQLGRFAPDAICLTDDPACDIDLPQFRFPQAGAIPDAQLWPAPAIAVDQLVAYIFTSGSTGVPVPHAKTWGRLVRCVQTETERLRAIAAGPYAIVATVPPQHMYGFESTVLLPLQSGHALCAERPFYPTDVASALAAAPAPRMLVSTPVHLRTLLAANVDLPAMALILSATAPLDEDLARKVEARYAAPLLEIYGSTETGQIASRRTTQTAEWLLWPGVSITVRNDQTWVEGGHVEAATPVGDILEVTGADRFLLRGRVADLVNIAGKRSSLAYLDHQLTSIPGVIDGAFFLREGAPATEIGITRLGALVVAPSLDEKAITTRLRERLDPAFLPRPLLLVPEIRRNATGKLPLHVLQSLLPDP